MNRTVVNTVVIVLIALLAVCWQNWSRMVSTVVGSDLRCYANEIRASRISLSSKERLLDRIDGIDRQMDHGKQIGLIRWWRTDRVVRGLLAGGLTEEKARLVERELQRASDRLK